MFQSSDVVLVTGASGFVGASVARALITQGARVRLLIRATSPMTNVAGLDAEMVVGDLTDTASLQAAVAGVRGVFHVAADYRLWAPDPQEIIRNNLAQTRNIMSAALRAGVERIVYTSSVATIKPLPLPSSASPSSASEGADESRAVRPGDAIGVYKRSKTMAERLVEAMIAEQGLPAVIVNPSTPIGPRDVRPTPTGRIIVEAANGKMPAFVDSGLNLAHVEDIAAGHLLAYARGRIGERYILGGENVSLGEMLGVIAGLVGRRAPTIRLPRWPLFPLAIANEWRARAFGGDPFLTVDGLKMARHAMFFSSAKARRELGYTARPYQQALVDAVDWFRDAGMIGR